MRELLKNDYLEDVLNTLSLNKIFDFLSEIGDKAGVGTLSVNIEDFIINYVEFDGEMNRLKIAKLERDDNKQMAFIENNMFSDLDYNSQGIILSLFTTTIEAYNDVCEPDEEITYDY